VRFTRSLLLLVPLAVVVVSGAPAARETARPTALRYIFDSGGAQASAAAAGWNLLDVSSKAEADALPPRTRGLMWLGDYDNSSCTWEQSDAEIAKLVAGTARDRRVFGFLFSDEPDPFACPNAPAQHSARAALIRRLSGGKTTVIVVDSNSGNQTLDQIPLWRGAADRIALDPYPCYRGKPCDFGWVRRVVAAADAAQLRYWGVVQAFSDQTWRWPTPAEARRLLSTWAASKASVLMTFSWRWDGHQLRSNPKLLDVLRRFNRAAAPRRVLAEHSAATARATEVHYTFTTATSVAFDWRGGASAVRVFVHGRWKTFRARAAAPTPFSTSGPFRQARIGGLKVGTTYRYAIGAGPVATFHTAPTGPFRFDVEADVGDSHEYPPVAATQAQIAGDKPSFVLVPGDLTYGNDDGQAAVDRHFNDVMTWSRHAAYMPAWGNHEWDKSTDDLRNYKGRFALPHPAASPGAPAAGCCGQDWSWFDAGPVRFIAYPEPYTSATWAQWKDAASKVMAAAQASPRIHFIVTFGHRPAYSTGYHHGDSQLSAILDSFGDRYSKYVLNLNGHSHDYERFLPIHHVVHVTAAGGGADLEPLSAVDKRTAFRALHLIHVRVDVTSNRLSLQAVCGPSTSDDQFRCTPGQIVDSYVINAPQG
jgi:calcineurin-like phosphoesterase family protein